RIRDARRRLPQSHRLPWRSPLHPHRLGPVAPAGGPEIHGPLFPALRQQRDASDTKTGAARTPAGALLLRPHLLAAGIRPAARLVTVGGRHSRLLRLLRLSALPAAQADPRPAIWTRPRHLSLGHRGRSPGAELPRKPLAIRTGGHGAHLVAQ